MSDYIPQTDEGFRTYAENFAQNISLDPAKFMLTSAQAASIQAVVDEFVAKLAIAENEATRTKQTIADKNDARGIAKNLIRQYAIDIKFNEASRMATSSPSRAAGTRRDQVSPQSNQRSATDDPRHREGS